jgi:glucosylglycerate synthase
MAASHTDSLMTQTQLQSTGLENTMVTAADVVIGIPTYNNAGSVAHALRTTDSACAVFGGDATCVIVHVDGASTDGTVERAAEVSPENARILRLAYSVDTVERMLGPYRAVPVKGNAVRAVFESARRLGAKACAIVDVEIDRFARGWLDSLVRPVLAHDRDFVAPYYTRHTLGGPMTNGVVYPLTRALYGKRLRFPMGGDFACSMRFIDQCLSETTWDTEVVKSTIDLWLTTRALAGHSRVAQAMVGIKHQTWKEAGPDAAEPLVKTLAAVFDMAERWQTVWQKVRGSEKIETFGMVDMIDDAPTTVSSKRGIDSFRLGQRNLGEIWKLVLPPRTLLELKKLALAPESSFHMPDDVWARIVYDFTLAYHQRTLHREHMLSAFAPLFAGWVASFVAEVPDATLAESEGRLDRMCLRFESEKPYLIARWRSPDRFNP